MDGQIDTSHHFHNAPSFGGHGHNNITNPRQRSHQNRYIVVIVHKEKTCETCMSLVVDEKRLNVRWQGVDDTNQLIQVRWLRHH